MQSTVLPVCTTCIPSSLWLETYRTQHKIFFFFFFQLTTNLLIILQNLPPNFIQLYRPPFAAPLEAVTNFLNNNTFAICGETANEHRVI